MKKESRVAVIVNQDEYWGICVFRGDFIEEMFFGSSKDEVLNQFNLSSVRDEVMYTNFNYKMPIQTDYEKLENTCENLVKSIGRKINK
ncbi:MAG: hypothetical protein OWQ54_00835 [Sulfolobaceae archaeon]|nr:hypothetical protein [Sulfolobaceae archaeon]